MFVFKRYPIIPALCLLPVIICGIFGPLFYPHDPTMMNLGSALKPPAFLPGGEFSYFLGTDHMGRDLLSRLIEGARISLLISVFGVLLSGLIGCSLGMLAGYMGGKADEVIMRVVDAQMSIPAILLTILLAAALGVGVTTIIVAISVVFWTGYARVIRGETVSLKQREFVVLAKVTGCSKARILIRHIFPNLISTITVLATLQLGRAILIEASITFLGVGLQPPDTAWGLMISEGRMYMATAWWIPTFAGLAIMATVLGSNLMGDWLRDKFDPKLRQL
ncbi:MAG: ABC transporter permease [Deltaproteobacteria bacterium]|nr:ABC transporter permease [Deltaproteobacteria bacterium]